MDDKLKKAADRQAGRVTSGHSLVAYTPEAERAMKALPAVTTYRGPLQNADGTFKFAIDPLETGSPVPGRFYINEFGKYVPY